MKICKKCGTSFDGRCKPCAAVGRKKYKANNPEKVKASNHSYRISHPNAAKERSAKIRALKPIAPPKKVVAEVRVSIRADDKLPLELKQRQCKKCGILLTTAKCKPCSNAGNKIRYIKNKEAILIARAEYRDRNREYLRAKNALFRLKNPEKIKKQNDSWTLRFPDWQKNHYDANKEEALNRNSKWRLKNPGYDAAYNVLNRQRITEYRRINIAKIRVNRNNRRVRKLENGGKLSSGIIKKLFLIQKGRCACCNQPLGDNYHMDHIMPLKLGGLNADENMQLLRAKCNLQKGAKHPIDFMQLRGFLI